jgi:hypothetical protein
MNYLPRVGLETRSSWSLPPEYLGLQAWATGAWLHSTLTDTSASIVRIFCHEQCYWGREDKGDWWRGWIQLCYSLRTFVNVPPAQEGGGGGEGEKKRCYGLQRRFN